ncbi:MAG: hypothetical protein OEP95_12590 [Myxococcales bacterium]|nr:hypothetical protein [Myxococcales bacterium]
MTSRASTQRLKGVVLEAMQRQLVGMKADGTIRLADDDLPDVMTEKVDPAAWYELPFAEEWLRQARAVIGPMEVADFGERCARTVAEMGLHQQFKVAVEEQGFGLASRLVLTFGLVALPDVEWNYLEISESGFVLETSGIESWSMDVCEFTGGFVRLLGGLLYAGPVRVTSKRTSADRVLYTLALA